MTETNIKNYTTKILFWVHLDNITLVLLHYSSQGPSTNLDHYIYAVLLRCTLALADDCKYSVEIFVFTKNDSLWPDICISALQIIQVSERKHKQHTYTKETKWIKD